MAFDYRQEFHRYERYYLKLADISKKPLAKASLGLSATIVTVAVLILIAIRPTLITIATLTRQIEDRQKLTKQLATKIKTLEDTKVSFTKIQNQLPLVETALPSKPEFLTLEPRLEYLAWKNNVLLGSGGFSGFIVADARSQEEKKKEQELTEKSQAAQNKKANTLPASDLKFTLTIGGSYDQITQFLEDLESMDRFLLIESITFSSQTEIKGVPLQASLAGFAFYKPPGEM